MVSCAMICCFRPTLEDRLSAANMAKVIKPNPPHWISTITTTCPKVVRESPTLTTDNPVMVTAEVAVNNACNHVNSPLWENGSFSKIVPITMKLKKPNARILGGLRLIRLCFLLISSFLDRRIGPTIRNGLKIVVAFQQDLLQSEYLFLVKWFLGQFHKAHANHAVTLRF